MSTVNVHAAPAFAILVWPDRIAILVRLRERRLSFTLDRSIWLRIRSLLRKEAPRV